MSEDNAPAIVPLSDATHKEMPEGHYYHFFIRHVPVMTRVVMDPGKKTKPHYHEVEEQTYYVLKGRGLLFVGDETYEVAANMAIMIPPGQYHALENTGNEPLEWIMQYLWPGEAAFPVYEEAAAA